jgi:hypothetical protein
MPEVWRISEGERYRILMNPDNLIAPELAGAAVVLEALQRRIGVQPLCARRVEMEAIANALEVDAAGAWLQPEYSPYE